MPIWNHQAALEFYESQLLKMPCQMEVDTWKWLNHKRSNNSNISKCNEKCAVYIIRLLAHADTSMSSASTDSEGRLLQGLFTSVQPLQTWADQPHSSSHCCTEYSFRTFSFNPCSKFFPKLHAALLWWRMLLLLLLH